MDADPWFACAAIGLGAWWATENVGMGALAFGIAYLVCWLVERQG